MIALTSTARLDPARRDEKQCSLFKAHELSCWRAGWLLILLTSGRPGVVKLVLNEWAGLLIRTWAAGSEVLGCGLGVGVACLAPRCWLYLRNT